MAKKNRRQASKTTGSMVPPRASEFSPDYTAVKADLKRIGILAGTFFTVLIVLSFFLR